MYNTLATEQAIARFLDRHNLEGGYALLMIDFDNFKIINDRRATLGDQAICAAPGLSANFALRILHVAHRRRRISGFLYRTAEHAPDP